jgi:hypothetical protein
MADLSPVHAAVVGSIHAAIVALVDDLRIGWSEHQSVMIGMQPVTGIVLRAWHSSTRRQSGVLIGQQLDEGVIEISNIRRSHIVLAETIPHGQGKRHSTGVI